MTERGIENEYPESEPGLAVIDGVKLPIRDGENQPQFDAMDSLLRLVIGGATDASEILIDLLEKWEAESSAQIDGLTISEREDASVLVRYLLIGIIFESQHAMRSSVKRAGSLVMGAAGLTATVTRPVRNSFLFAPLQRRTDRVAEALEDRILSLIQTGRSQEQIGRLMAEDAVSESIESVFDYIAHNPQIRDLVQEQALGFTGEITVGTREALLTVDSAFDNLLRKIFRRKPRADLKGPPEAVMKLEQHYNYQEQGRAK